MKQKIDETLLLKRSFNVKDFRAAENIDDNEYFLEGHAAVFNSETSIGGWYTEIIERGAFDECNFDDVPFFTNHKTSKIPLARSRRNNGNNTMNINIDEKGLFIRAKLDVENNVEAKQLYSSVKREDISGMSFSFRVKEQSWENLDQAIPIRRIKKIAKVYEVSAVNDPAYEDTDITARDKAALDNAKNALDNARSSELENSNAVELYKIKNKILGGV